jgi:hypothetical protein
MIAPYYTPWRWVLGGGRSAVAQFDLLERLDCLSPKGRADRAGIIALIERTEREFRPPPAPSMPLPGSDGRWVEDEINDALARAGYLSDWGEVSEQMRVRPGFLRPFLAEVDAAHSDARTGPALANDLDGEARDRPASEPGGDQTCLRCTRMLPPVARFCGYCGTRLDWAPLDGPIDRHAGAIGAIRRPGAPSACGSARPRTG